MSDCLALEAILEDTELLLREPGSKPSISFIQRRIRIRYNTAALIMEALERRGVVSPPDCSGARTLRGAEKT